MMTIYDGPGTQINIYNSSGSTLPSIIRSPYTLPLTLQFNQSLTALAQPGLSPTWLFVVSNQIK